MSRVRQNNGERKGLRGGGGGGERERERGL